MDCECRIDVGTRLKLKENLCEVTLGGLHFNERIGDRIEKTITKGQTQDNHDRWGLLGPMSQE